MVLAVPAWVEESVSPVKQSSSGGATHTNKLAVKTGLFVPVCIPPQAENTTTNILYNLQVCSKKSSIMREGNLRYATSTPHLAEEQPIGIINYTIKEL